MKAGFFVALWRAGLPKRSFGRAFHWQPVRSTYKMASKICRGGMADL
jgi:hypothetical protein